MKKPELIRLLARKIQAGTLSPVKLTEELLARIEKLNPHLKAFIAVTRERALAEAERAAKAIQNGQYLGPLHGIPYAVKDLFDVEGLPTMAGTRLLAGNIANFDAASVRRLSQAGMILLGKTHTVQLAFGGVGINHDQGTPHNPWKEEAYVPGGSSSGSAVAVAAGMIPLALGTDTGGSIRIPAALCGIVGLKTTVGRISRYGVYPLSETLDSVGILTRSVEDAALGYQALQGYDPDVLAGLKDGVKGMRIVFSESVFFDGVDKEVEDAVRETGRVFTSLGARVERMEIPEIAEANDLKKRALFIAYEASKVNKKLLSEHFAELDPVIADRMKAGENLTLENYRILRQKWVALEENLVERLKECQAILAPTTMIPARSLTEVDVSLETYMEINGKYLRNTSIGNILNLCAVSVPCGFTADGLPIGLMIYAKPFDEATALRIAYAFEQATPWHNHHADLSWAD